MSADEANEVVLLEAVVVAFVVVVSGEHEEVECCRSV